ncbi:hypothetical protein RT723_04635 [Psychrosphaera aquimarina]|uniref:Uncharacterized protein n=1 Tax=Psychrosphaera aquimarina TaxID=2044854 RepID=A0ABU3QYS4_9GAMM|nr:hypothetical protein [Psychrosphaera aquimarina]MDU0112295.1 hypothetical protein [Psychrosphaera aquimarina]
MGYLIRLRFFFVTRSKAFINKVTNGFYIFQDVIRSDEAYFRAYKHIDGGVSSKKSQQTMQQCFDIWQQQTGYSYQTLSRVLSFSVGDNFVGVVTDGS